MHHLKIVFFALLIAIFHPYFSSTTVAAGLDDMRWFYDQFNDETNRGRTTSVIGTGVPETDHVIFEGSCVAGSSGSFSTVTFGADVSGMPEGANVSIEFMTDAGPYMLNGNVYGTRLEVGVAGVQVIIENNDPLWSFLSSMSRINYRVNGNVQLLPLRGSSAAIQNFLADCNYYAGIGGQAQSPAAPSPMPASDTRWETCNTLGSEISLRSEIPVNLTFINHSDGFRSVMWIGFDGTPKEYAGLNPGEDFTIQTFVTHPWMITDGPGNCLEMYMPQQGQSVFHITAPNLDFGPE